MKFPAVLTVGLSAVLAGCSSMGLEPAGKEEAKVTLSMMSELDGASKAFTTSHARSVAYLNRVSADQRLGLFEARKTIAREQGAASAVADEKAQAIQKRLTALVATLEANATSNKTVEELEAETKELLKPLPQPTAALAASKKAVAALMEGVSAETRRKELEAYVSIARNSVKDAKEKLNAPDTAASAATSD